MEPLIPDSAPFTPEQRAWLNGFVAGLLGMERALDAAAGGMAEPGTVKAAAGSAGAAFADAAGKNALPGAALHAAAGGPSVSCEEDFPWHDPALTLQDRLKLAEHRPVGQRLMAAMGQLDCGQCGYLCQSYAEAIAAGSERNLGKCVPGGRATARKLKELLELAGTPADPGLSSGPGADSATAGAPRGAASAGTGSGSVARPPATAAPRVALAERGYG